MDTIVIKRPRLALRLLVLLLLLLLLDTNIARASQCLREGVEEQGKAFQVEPGFVLEKKAQSLRQCKKLCLHWKRCGSVNWMANTGSCDLILTTYPDQSDLVPLSGSVFAPVEPGTCGDGNMPDPCAALPCSHSEMCVPTKSMTSFVCLPYHSCEQPPSRNHSEVTVHNDGVTAIYTCHSNYSFHGNSPNVTCLVSGRWSHLSGQCLPVCTSPPTLPNGVFTVTTDGRTATVTCHSSYYFNGNSTNVLCEAPGVWSTLYGQCLPLCTSPPTIANGGFTVSSDGIMATYTCDSNYRFHGDSPNITCKADGEWSTLPGQCVWDCGDPGTLANGDFVSDGVTANYSCNAGFFYSGEAALKNCATGSPWTPLDGQCLELCGTLPNPEEGTYTQDGKTATLDCVAGFQYRGINPSIQCQAGKTWSTHDGSCQPVECGTPPTVANGTMVASTETTTFGKTRQYQCSPGYVANGSMQAVCQASGTWARDAACLNLRCREALGYAPSSEGLSCLKFYTSQARFTAAESKCTVDNTHLVFLKVATKRDVILSFVTPRQAVGYDGVWLGGTHSGGTGYPNSGWLWKDGTTVDMSVFNAFKVAGEPSNIAGENCMTLYQDGKWYNVPCELDHDYGSLCETAIDPL